MDLVDATVLEVGEYVAVPYAGKLLSDTGAEVIKLEPPDGDVARGVGPFGSDDPDPNRSEFFAYLNTGKRSVVLPEDPALAREVIHEAVSEYGVDVVLDDRLGEYGIDPRALAEGIDPLSVISVTGFGGTGPWGEYDAPDIVAWAESGHMNKMGYPDSPPARPRIKAADYWAGQVAAIGALSALHYRDLQGGTGQYVDVAKRDAGTSAMEHFVAGYSWSGETTERTGVGYPNQDGEHGLRTLYEAADGYIAAEVTGAGRWERFCTEFLDRPELADDERFDTVQDRRERLDAVTEIVEDYTRRHDRWDLFERLQEAGMPSGVTATPEDLANLEHLEARDFWQEIPLPDGGAVTMPGFPFRVEDGVVSMDRAPRLGEHTGSTYRDLGYDPEAVLAASSGTAGASPSGVSESAGNPARDRGETQPLDGVRVLDFTWVYAGPHGSKLLAALGADVVKVESKQKPDITRGIYGYGVDLDGTSSASAYFNEHNQGKRGIRLDLTDEHGREIALDLMREADLVMENFSPDFMDRVGLDHERIREVNPEIVYLSMPGWAKSGPAKSYRSLGMTLQAMAGLDHVSGHPDDPPTPSGHSWPDPTAGYMGAIAALMGLRRRERTGEGTYIELPQFEMTVSLLHKPVMEYVVNGRMPERVGNRDEDGRYVQGVYPCAGEDRWVVVAFRTDGQWRRLCSLLGRPDLADDDRFASQYRRLRRHDEIDELLGSWTGDRTPEEARHRLRKRGVPAGIVADERDLLEYDPQLRARDYFATQDVPRLGERRLQGVPFEMGECDVRFRSRAPRFGEHTDEVMEEWLGMSEEETSEAEATGALY